MHPSTKQKEKRFTAIIVSSSFSYIYMACEYLKGLFSDNSCHKTDIINAYSGLFCNELFMNLCFKNSSLSVRSISELNW